MIIAKWVTQATEQLAKAGVTSPRLDAELIACLALGYNRARLLAHDNEEFPLAALEKTTALLERRLLREPMAYLRGSQEFFGRDFIVTPNTLIPRPESETIITLLKKMARSGPGALLDVGTGSGCLAITASLELPHLTVDACDIAPAALAVARKNAAKHNASVNFYTSNLLATPLKKHQTFDYIIANLPYVDHSWKVSAELAFEPAHALFAQQQGLALIAQLIEQIPQTLRSQGLLLIEADPRQHDKILAIAEAAGFKHVTTGGFITVFQA